MANDKKISLFVLVDLRVFVIICGGFQSQKTERVLHKTICVYPRLNILLMLSAFIGG